MTILQDRETRIFSSSILPLVGYGLLLMAVVNISFLLIPLQLTNPLWEFQTVGAIIERMPFILLGIVLICCGERSYKPLVMPSLRASIKIFILKSLSWFSLIFAIVLLLVIPFNINNSLRIYHQNNITNPDHFSSQINKIESFKKQLLFASSQEEVTAIIQQQARLKLNFSDSIDTQELKGNILKELQNYRDNITSQIETFRAQKRLILLKNCFKWDFEALIAAILFFRIWKSTGWTRTKVISNKN